MKQLRLDYLNVAHLVFTPGMNIHMYSGLKNITETLSEAQRTQALLLQLELGTNLVTRWWRHLVSKFGTNAG